ncbi:hypothetical protein L2E82_38637 [Cichorium intybus]|uniref:Uncharacterized protein n=1 Tax=Cichorium intybus TaxID=13427 RepID=A0ACB9AHK7_CICIN|nr:hypothetical protein L2E82_38637 [Cichorium intybus]
MKKLEVRKRVRPQLSRIEEETRRLLFVRIQVSYQPPPFQTSLYLIFMEVAESGGNRSSDKPFAIEIMQKRLLYAINEGHRPTQKCKFGPRCKFKHPKHKVAPLPALENTDSSELPVLETS